MDLAEVALALIAGGLITQLIGAYRARADVRNADRKQRLDESTGAASAAKAITDAAGTIVKLADDQVEEFKQQIRALQSESSALGTRLDLEIQKRLRSEAAYSVLEDQVNRLRDQLAGMGAQFEMADQERQALRRENGAMKTKLFEMSVGVQTLARQVRGAGLEPEYMMEVPALEPTRTQPLGQLDVNAVKSLA